MPLPYSLTQSLDLLSRTPATVRALLQGLPDQWLYGNEGPDSFSPFDVVGHLIDGEEELWLTRARRIRDQGEDRTFAPFDRVRHKARNAGRGLEELLEEFGRLRQANLATLRGWDLNDRDLDQTGRHPEFGEVTLRQLLATWVVHDLGHLAQISRVMAKQYAGEVGPWKAYLSVLRDRT